jgi:hypothetical protein
VSSVESLSPEALALMHELRLRGLLSVPDDAVSRELTDCGLARRVDLRLALTPEGRDAHARWARVPAGSEAEAALERGYRQFLDLNETLLRVCTDWQMRSAAVPNDHSDLEYDWAVVDRLVTFDDRAAPIVRRLGETLPRFEPYRSRLRSATRQVHDGEHEWLLSPRCDSYHTVWMQLHEDLLLALGLDRVAEERAG